MIDRFYVKDEFCDKAEEVRASALIAGFGTLTPANTEMGSGKYEGMGFLGRHDLMMRALVQSLGGRPVFPGEMFFRVTKPDTERAFIHSDRGQGDWTCVAYLSKHEEFYGTAFYRHRKTGWTSMPAPEDLKRMGLLKQFNECMKAGDEEDWEQTDMIRGIFNRAVIFHAPLFHSRLPVHGIGKTDDEARLVWVCHFYV